jgi:hypothetical protein
MAGKDAAGIPRSAVIDDITRFMVVLQGDEHRVHLGKQFHAFYQQQVTDTNDISCLAWNTPLASTGKYMHVVVEGHSTDQVEFRFIETPSIDEAEASGTFTALNRFRNHTNTSLVHDLTPVKASGSLEWTGISSEGDEFSIGADVYLVAALEATATGAGKIWVDLGDGLAATMVTNAVAAIDAAQATSANSFTVEATDGTGDVVDLDADQFGTGGNLAVTVVTGANITATSMTGGVGAPNDGGDTEIYGAVNKMSTFDKTNAATANITTTTSLINEIIGQAAGNPAQDSQAGLARGEREWILRPGTQYCLYMKSLNANDNIHTLDIHWYEVDHKDGTTDAPSSSNWNLSA